MCVATHTPRLKPALLQVGPPHQAATAVVPENARAVVTFVGLSQVLTFAQAPLFGIAKPWLWYQTLLPPASHSLMFLSLAVNGAMKRALMSGGAMLRVLDFVTSRNASSVSWWAHLFVTRIARTTYSWTMLQPLFGSTRTSPPSPPKFELIFDAPGRRIEPPLSCSPPLTSMFSPP